MPAKISKGSSHREVAFYYPGPVWSNGDWIKNLILFFDGVALLVPNYIRDKPHVVDPAIAAGLENAGLLHILEPEKIIDKESTEKLANAITQAIASGAFDSIAQSDAGAVFHELSYSRLGSFGDPGIAKAILQQLKARKLARDSEDGVSIPMHPMVRALILVLWAQILRPCGPPLGLELSPATDRPQLVKTLERILSLPTSPSKGHVVSLDLQTVGVDLRSIPIDEVLTFRKENLKKYRAYISALRRFLSEISQLSQKERFQALKERDEEIRALADELRSESRRAWKRPAYFALTLMGGAYSLKSGSVLGAILSLSPALLAPPGKPETRAHAYSYLFSASERFH
ncbi:MAG: hypothetical protein ACRD4X_01485 [Candidatus Acidiferrales bacterium]